METFSLVVNRHDGGQEGDGARLVRLADVLKVFVAGKLAEFTRYWCFSFMFILARVLFLEHLDTHFLFVGLLLFREHLEQSVDHFAVVYFLHALETKNARSWVLFVDLQHALNGWQWLVVAQALTRSINGHEDEVILEPRIGGQSLVSELDAHFAIVHVQNRDFPIS